ncbi:MAG: glycyl-radical enzyme activating protein [Lachnospiraceae bacterium]|nr:glycyl-radical enzyme activating protein [Lachnospiraceae bacterium]
MNTPLILNLKGNSLDDGPGIRTAVFVKGCPLDCVWCHNPEGKKTEAELFVSPDKCIGCRTCESVCEKQAASPDHPGIVDRSKCVRCFSCVEKCPPKCLERLGTEMSIESIVEKCLKDKPFYDISGGGVTLTGGEAAMFPEWCGELASQLYLKGIKVYLETSGHFNYEKVRRHLYPSLSGIYMDIKLIDRDAHIKYCGVPNDLILKNLQRVYKDSRFDFFFFMTRTPLIPGITDTDENLSAIADLYVKIGISETELLPYNPTWYKKAEGLGTAAKNDLIRTEHWQTEEKLEHCKEIFRKRNIAC